MTTNHLEAPRRQGSMIGGSAPDRNQPPVLTPIHHPQTTPDMSAELQTSILVPSSVTSVSVGTEGSLIVGSGLYSPF